MKTGASNDLIDLVGGVKTEKKNTHKHYTQNQV